MTEEFYALYLNYLFSLAKQGYSSGAQKKNIMTCWSEKIQIKKWTTENHMMNSIVNLFRQ